jgi:phage terminase large subunit
VTARQSILEASFEDIWAQASAPMVVDATESIHAHVGYQKNPVGWARDILGIPEHTIRWSLNAGYDAHQWDGEQDPLVVIAAAIADWQSVGVESGTGTGKSFWLAVLVLWFLASFEGARVFTFAPKEEQLRLYIWAEIGKLWPKFRAFFPAAELTDLRILMRAGDDGAQAWGAWGRAVALRAGEQVSSRAAGMHAKYMLLVNEETQGMAPAVIEAQENTCTGPFNVQLSVGNPDNQHDALHKACTAPGVKHVRMSALDHPNVVTDNPHLVEGAVSRASIERRQEKYGEQSPLYESRVRGLSPSQSTEALIRREWVDLSFARYRARIAKGPIIGPGAKGVDVAQSTNGDKAAIADWRGTAMVGVRSFHCPNATYLGRDVVMEAKRDGVQAEHVGIDPVGVGAATMNEAREKFGDDGPLVQALNGGLSPIEKAQKDEDGRATEWAEDANFFGNLRAQMWWQLREDLRRGRVDLAPNEDLAQQLTLPKYRVHNGKTWLESKEDLRKRTGGKSPDDADAVVYGNWVRPRAVELEHVDERWRQGRREPDRDPARFLTPDEAPASVTTEADALTDEELLDVGPFARQWSGARDSTFDWLGD